MIKKQTAKKGKPQTINLNMLEGEGSFLCPNCGITISPDDETEETYKIIDAKMVQDELAELTLSCKNCGTFIKLTGFQHIIDGITS